MRKQARNAQFDAARKVQNSRRLMLKKDTAKELMSRICNFGHFRSFKSHCCSGFFPQVQR